MKNKIIEFVIEPLAEWFDKDLTDGQIKVYHEVLNGYSAEILIKAMQDLKSSWDKRFPPLPANIKQVCDTHLPKTKPITTNEIKNMDFWAVADKVMALPISRIALQECWSDSLVCEVMNTGNLYFDDRDITRFRESHIRAENLAKTLSPRNEQDKALLGLWHTMKEREQKIIDRYKLN